MIEISEGKPIERGSYVAWVNPADNAFRFAERIFLIWDGNTWYYPMSDQRYRDTVYGWAGPLKGMELED